VPRQTGRDQPPCTAVLECRGHPNVALRHETTLEFEESSVLTPRGDCIACISCRGGDGVRGCAALRGYALAYIVAFNPWDGVEQFSIYGFSPGQKPRRLIVRKSEHVKDSIIVRASASASELPRRLVELLRSPFTRCMVLYAVLPLESAASKAPEEPPGGNEN
jgi:hypothetical protein